MAKENLKKGLVFTNDNCVGCNKCISVCSCMGATVAVETKEGKNVIYVDGDKCIACGACFDVCAHGAREYLDDTEEFLQHWQEERRFPYCWHRHFWQIIQRNTRAFLEA